MISNAVKPVINHPQVITIYGWDKPSPVMAPRSVASPPHVAGRSPCEAALPEPRREGAGPAGPRSASAERP